MLCHERGDPFGLPARDGRAKLRDRLEVEVGRRFVQHDECGRCRCGARARHALLLTARKRKEALVDQGRKVELPCRSIHLPFDVGGLESQILAPEGDFPSDVDAIELGFGVLKDAADESCGLPELRMRDIEAAHTHGAGFRPFVEMRGEAVREACDGGLAAAGWPAQQSYLASSQRQGDPFDARFRAPSCIGERNILHEKDGGFGLWSFSHAIASGKTRPKARVAVATSDAAITAASTGVNPMLPVFVLGQGAPSLGPERPQTDPRRWRRRSS